MQHRATAVASRALVHALRGESFTVADLKRGVDDPPSRQTVYRVLRQLAADDWIAQEGKTWEPALRARTLGDVDEDGRGFDLGAADVL